ncbi:MAG: hypothetical protein ACKPEN_16785 [Planktothrix sp.]|uniref:hypothetical protein n=2 Tax=Planktothrix sp. TaxID=3088171 RepID=UPI0038D3D277
MINLFQFLLKVRSSQKSPKLNSSSGMTMIELLVGTVIAFIIITPLMGMVIGLLNDDSRESAKASTEQEIQSALEYITEDVSQALYIYTDTTSTDPQLDKQIDQLKTNNFLPTTGDPILVFWKRKIIENAVPVDLAKTPLPKDCDENDQTKKCNDTYVLSLVSYHLLRETKQDSIWCQPKSTDLQKCPSRIIRYEISDWLKKTDGTAYTKAEVGTNLASYGTDNPSNEPFNSLFRLDQPLVNVTNGGSKFPSEQVLVNYIEDFKLDGTSTNNLAKINITANSARRIDSNAASCINKSSAYCVQSSVQVRGLSGLGTSE